MISWDEWFLGLCDYVALRSKDPSSKVGAVIVRPNRTIVSLGYNGFPRGVADHPERYEDRELKYEMIVHAEMNAILTAREPLDGYTIYVSPFTPCARCAQAIIQSGIRNVKIREWEPERWRDQGDLTRKMFNEAGVSLKRILLS